MNDRGPESVAAHEKDTWSRSAEIYPETFSLVTGQNLPCLLERVQITEGTKVLDIGCGPGDVSELLRKRGADVTGIDFAAPMIAVAKRRFPNITFHEADVEDLPFVDSTFDVVIGNMVVHHFARPESAFNEVRRVLKPGGAFAFIVPIPDTQTSFTAFAKALMEHMNPEAVPSGPLYNVSDESVYESLLTAAGFYTCEFAHPEIACRVPNLDPLLRGGWEMAQLSNLPQEIQDNIRRDTTRNAEAYRHDGGYVFPDVMFLGVARKP